MYLLNNILKIPKMFFSSANSADSKVKNNYLRQDAILSDIQNERFFLPPREMRFCMNQPAALYNMADSLKNIVDSVRRAEYDVVILCIGTDRSTGDALGPLTGTKLKSISVHPDIYGTLDEPVHAANLEGKIKFINNNYQSPFIIAVDACLGKMENIGWFALGRGAVKPGAAVNKDLPEVGDAYITGTVNVGGFMEHMVLQSTRLNLVVKMADTIAHGLSFALGRKSSG
jgi:putative sporulation protein YyaC